MFLSCFESGGTAETDAVQERIELIVDLNRRICLLDELMMAARAKRRTRREGEFLPAVFPTV